MRCFGCEGVFQGKRASQIAEQIFTELAAAVRLAKIGLELRKQEWIDDGLRTATELSAVDLNRQGAPAELTGLLERAGRAMRAEQLLLEQLATQARIPVSDQGGNYAPWLVELAGLYHRAGRHADVLRLLDEGPGWQAADLREQLLLTDNQDTCLGVMASSALAALGKKDKSVAVLQELLRRRPG